MNDYLTCWEETETKLYELLENRALAATDVVDVLRKYRSTLPPYGTMSDIQRQINAQVLKVIVVCLELERASKDSRTMDIRLNQIERNDIALALILLKDLKTEGHFNIQVSKMVWNLARLLGVQVEYERLTSKIPPMDIKPRQSP